MSPNGRRAWRKWVRRVEHNPRLRPSGKSISRLAREGKRHLGSIPPTPPKPFTSRSIVGMTQGSRKRAIARCEQVDLDPVHRLWFRLGQRLRPCPGCHTCMPGVKGWHIDKVRGRFKMPTIAWSCDGSGVLPARRSK